MSRERKTRSTDNAVKPPTIDLEATEVAQGEELAADTSASASGEAAPEAPSASEAAESIEVGEETEGKRAEAPDEAVSEDPAASQESTAEETAEEPVPVAAQSGGRRWLAVAVIAVIAAGAGAFLYRDYGAQIFASSKTAATIDKLNARMAALEKAQSTAAGDVTAAGDKAKAATEGLAKANARLDQMTAGLDDLKSEMGASDTSAAGLKTRLDELARTAQQSASEIAGLQSALDAAAKAGKSDQQPGTAGAVQIAAFNNSVNALKERVKALEDGFASARSEVSSLSARLDDIARQPRAPEAGSKVAHLAAAYAAVEKRISEGKPFAAELDRLKGLDPNLPGLAELASVAGKGVLGESDLASGLDRALSAASGATQAAKPSGKESWLAALKRRVFSVIKIRKVGEPDWQVAGAMAKAALARGDLDGAVAALGPATGKTPQPIAQWLTAANARRQVLDRLAGLSAAVFQSVKRNAS